MIPSKEACEHAVRILESDAGHGHARWNVEVANYLRSLHEERTCETCGFGLPSSCEPARCKLGMDHCVKHCAHWKPREAEEEKCSKANEPGARGGAR
jgi:hypothetical protein